MQKQITTAENRWNEKKKQKNHKGQPKASMKEEENVTNAEINIKFYIPNITLAKAPCYKNNNVEKDSYTVPSSFSFSFS